MSTTSSPTSSVQAWGQLRTSPPISSGPGAGVSRNDRPPGRADARFAAAVHSPDDPVGIHAVPDALYVGPTGGVSKGEGTHTLPVAHQIIHRHAAGSARGGRHPDHHRARSTSELSEAPARGRRDL